MKSLLFFIVLFLFSYSSAYGLDSYGSKWDQKKVTVEPARDVEIVDLSGVQTIFGNTSAVGGGGMDAGTLNGQPGTFYQNRDNHTGFQLASTISDFKGAVLLTSLSSGIESHTPGDDTAIKVTFSAITSNLVDIAAGDCHVQGNEFDFPAVSSVDPEFGAGENSKWFGCSASGLVNQTLKFTTSQKRTIMPIARIQAAGSCTGPGCPVSRLGILDHRYIINEDGFRWEEYLAGAIGSRIESGGILTESATTDRNLDISNGIMWNTDRMKQTWGSFTSIIGLHWFHIGGVGTITEEVFSMDNINYDNGTDLTAMTNNNYHCSNTVLMSPRGTQDAEFSNLRFAWIHCQSEWPDLQGAIDSGIDFGPFQSESISGWVPLAQVITKKNTANIIKIINVRGGIGAVSGGTVSTLQGAYNNSSPGSPEIVLNDVQDGFTIQDSATGVPDGLLFRLQKKDGTPVFSVTTSFHPGLVVQHNYTAFGSVVSGIALIPQDVSIPQQTEGFLIFSSTWTPLSPSSDVIIEAVINGSHSVTSARKTCAVFKDSILDAVSVQHGFYSIAAKPHVFLVLKYQAPSLSTIPRTYKIRCGDNNVGTTYINAGSDGTALFGGAWISSMEIREVLQ